MHVEGIKHITAPNIRVRVFAKTNDLEFLGKHREHWGWVHLFFLSVCVGVYRMGSGDCESFTWCCVREGGWLEFFDEKINKEWVAYPLSPFPEV